LPNKIRKILLEIRSWITIIIIALLLKVTIVEAYIVPTGSMENTIMTGDFLIGTRLAYGTRTPDWIGIPYTDIGIYIPYFRFPEFKRPTQGDVIIFRYPRDPHHKYVKRCVAGPGDTIEIKDRKLYVNDEEYPLPDNGKFVYSEYPKGKEQPGIYLGKYGNKDHFKSIHVPKKGDIFTIDKNTDWRFLLPLIIMDGHEATLESHSVRYKFTTTDPMDLYRRKGDREVFDPYFPKGKLLNPWSPSIRDNDFSHIQIDGIPIRDINTYTIKQDYYWAMGDNRDDSLDSRFWGFVPHNNILGEALFVYFSLDLDRPSGFWIPRLSRVGTVLN